MTPERRIKWVRTEFGASAGWFMAERIKPVPILFGRSPVGAQIVGDKDVPKDVVRMGSTVTFKSDDGNTRTLKLVYPADESLDDHRISIMTPVGAALIGLGTGQSISWTARDCKHHRLTVTKVA